MKLRLVALAAALAAACAWGQGATNVSPMDPCAGKDDNASCTEPRSGKAGTCTWLTSTERGRMKIRTQTDCRLKGMHAGSCHTCVTPEQMSEIGAAARINDPAAAKKSESKPY